MTGATRPSFLVLAANTPWVYAMANSLAAHAEVTAVRMIDWFNNRRLKPQWPEAQSSFERVVFSMPPGYAGTFEPAFRPLLRALIDRHRGRLRSKTATEPFVICAYPYLAPWVRHIPGERLVYYNLDDYSLYDARRARRTRLMEEEIIERAGLTVCLSEHQAEAFRARHPRRASAIRHFPLGVNESFINPDPAAPVAPATVGYIGNMTERVDWRFIRQVAEAMPEARFHFVGNRNDGLSGANLRHDPEWLNHRAAVLGMPNVVLEGAVRQSEVPLHYWNYAVNWMPYDPRHPFNIASCPTKIMDALASGRPFVSTDIPESRLYPAHVHLASDPSAAVATIRGLLEGRLPHDAHGQVRFARSQTWERRAEQFLSFLNTA